VAVAASQFSTAVRAATDAVRCATGNAPYGALSVRLPGTFACPYGYVFISQRIVPFIAACVPTVVESRLGHAVHTGGEETEVEIRATPPLPFAVAYATSSLGLAPLEWTTRSITPFASIS
jgi:hypothetical protein